MLKYVTTAVALKCLSAGPAMRRLYRRMGNSVGNRRRSSGVMPNYYVERFNRTVRIANQFNIVKDGDRIVELGTGWLHWEALSLRLLWDVNAVLYDVWDNRQLGALKNYWGQLGRLLGKDVTLTKEQLRRARSILEVVAKVESFEELYKKLNLRYTVNADGSLFEFPNDSFDLVVSAGVLEHVDKDAVPAFVSEMYRILRPGGTALQSIDISDHLAHYDSSVSKKRYLSYSDRSWRLLFENKVQYINRIQRKEWMDLFRRAGFDVMEEDSRYVDIDNVEISSKYSRMSQADLGCTTLRVTLRKP